MRGWRLVSALLCVASFTSPVRASVPDPAHSTIPGCLATCPYGDIPFTVVVRDFANNPVAGASVLLDFWFCPAVELCPAQDPGIVIDVPARTARAHTDASGAFTFRLKAGGLCEDPGIRVFADGVQLTDPPVRVASVDQDGNLAVYGNDRERLAADPYTAGRDLDCDADRDDADLAILDAHMGHLCDAVVPARPQRWGVLKLRYR
jgi:hypothetical protein